MEASQEHQQKLNKFEHTKHTSQWIILETNHKDTAQENAQPSNYSVICLRDQNGEPIKKTKNFK